MKKIGSLLLLCLLATTVMPTAHGAKGKPNKQQLAQPAQQELRTKAQHFYLEGLKKKYQGKSTEAFDLFRHAVSIDTTLSGAFYEQAVYYAASNKPEQTVKSLRRAVANDPGNYWYNLMLGRVYEQYGQTEEATNVYKLLRQLFPYKEEVIEMLANFYIQTDSLQLAIETYDRLEELKGINEQTTLDKFRLYSRMGATDSAFAEINSLIAQAPMNVHYQIVKGDLLLEAGKAQEAFETYTQAKTHEPDNAYLLISLSHYYSQTGKPEESKKLIEGALINDNLDVATKVGILSNYLRNWFAKSREVKPAFELFEKLLQQHPQEVKLYTLYAGFLSAQEKKEEAIEQLQTAVGMAPNTTELWLQLLGLYMETEQYNLTIETCLRAKKYFPNSPEFFFYQGAASFQLKKYTDALAVYKEGVQWVPQNNPAFGSDFYGQIGDTYQMLNDMENCFEAYETALTLNPKNVVIMNNYAYFLSLQDKELGRAERMSGKCIELEPTNSTYLDTYAWIYFKQKQYSLAKFYIEQAISYGGDKNDVVLEHYGDILFMSGDTEGAILQWKKSVEIGNNSDILKQKIKTKTYIETNDEK